MQYLMVLLVSACVLVVMVGVVLGISYALGAAMHSRAGGQAEPGNADPCAQCQTDRDWYEDLPIWKRNLVTAWWLANRYQCAVRGCG
jgi:hypothetical protein